MCVYIYAKYIHLNILRVYVHFHRNIFSCSYIYINYGEGRLGFVLSNKISKQLNFPSALVSIGPIRDFL